jgi:predicted N-formylglutamate amidohydrolase
MVVKFSTENKVMNVESNSAAALFNADATSPFLLICEHASNYFPPEFDNLGLKEDVLVSHIAWDPGAQAVTEFMSDKLNAQAIIGRISRLVYDCNRPPEAIDAVPERSEIFEVPGNKGLTPEQYQERVALCFEPFHELVATTLRWSKTPRILVTVHSFTPRYKGELRDTEIGILHDQDTRLADAMLDAAKDGARFKYCRNKPYGPEDGVTFTLKRHGLENGLINVMIEVRNDLIADEEQQKIVADELCDILQAATKSLGIASTGEGGQ